MNLSLSGEKVTRTIERRRLVSSAASNRVEFAMPLGARYHVKWRGGVATNPPTNDRAARRASLFLRICREYLDL